MSVPGRASKDTRKRASSKTAKGGHSAPAPAPEARKLPAPDGREAERRRTTGPIDFGRALSQAFLTNERINQVLLEMIEPRIWRLFPPCSRRRNIATSFAHIHNVRCMRLKMSARSTGVPERLDRESITRDEASTALDASARAMAQLIESAVAAGGRVPEYRPDVVLMVCSAINHEAHHRGQICHWARELGAPLGPEQQLRMWEWDKRWKEVAGR